MRNLKRKQVRKPLALLLTLIMLFSLLPAAALAEENAPVQPVDFSEGLVLPDFSGELGGSGKPFDKSKAVLYIADSPVAEVKHSGRYMAGLDAADAAAVTMAQKGDPLAVTEAQAISQEDLEAAFAPYAFSASYKYYAFKAGVSKNNVVVHNRTTRICILAVPKGDVAAMPAATPAGAVFGDAVHLSLSTATPGAAIHYTTDGTTPTSASLLYTGEITVDSTTTIKAIATAEGMLDSWVMQETYEFVDLSKIRDCINEASAYAAEGDSRVYRSNDRYNGKIAITKSPRSFFAVMEAALNEAKALFIDNDSTKELKPDITFEKVAGAENNLKSAIDNLIFTVNVNPSPLYTILHPSNPKNENDYTAKSWAAYQSALAEAEALLDALFDEEGNPTEMNSSADTELTDRIAYLADAPNRLSYLNPYGIPYKQFKYDTLKRLFALSAPEQLSGENYTPESMQALTDARKLAQEYLRDNPDKLNADNFGTREDQALSTVYQSLWSGYFGLTDKKASITVKVKVIDGFAARYAEYTPPVAFEPLSGVYTVTLEEGKTMADLKSKLGFSERDVYSLPSGIRTRSVRYTLVNGLLLPEGTMPLFLSEPGDDARQLHDGDEITLAYAEHPTQPNSSGTGEDYFDYVNITNLYQSSSILHNGQKVMGIIEVDGAQPLELSAVTALCLLKNYTGNTFPFGGATVFVSPEAADTAAEVLPAGKKTAVVTDAEGNFSYTFYGEGYYALSVYSLEANDAPTVAPGLIAGDTIYVHVKGISPEQTAAARNKLREELDALYNTYPESFFNAADWSKLCSFYEAGIAAMDAADTLADVKKAQDTAIAGIKGIQEETVRDNTEKLSGFRSTLSRLPDDADLLGQSGAFLMDDLLSRYEEMSVYQKGRLTGLESAKYAALKAAYDAGLPEQKPYELRIEVAADSPEAKAAIEAMTAYVAQEGNDRELLYQFSTVRRDLDGKDIYGSSQSPAVNANPDSTVTFVPMLDMSTYSLKDGAGGEGWAILSSGLVLEDDTSLDSTRYIGVKGRTILIGGTPYEVKGVEATGVDTIRTKKGAAYDAEGNFTVGFPTAYHYFVMPYHDVTVTVTWGPVAATLQTEKDTARTVLETTYAGYHQADYSESNWTALTAARNNGLAAIDAAANSDEIAAARKAALAAMAIVKTIKQESDDSAQTGGDSGVPLPDYGSVVGRVRIIVENQTFTSAASHGGLPGWYGRLIDGWYDLCEGDTMMTAVLKALQLKGCRWTAGSYGDAWDNYDISYLATINAPASVEGDGDDFYVTPGGGKLGEFSGEQGSGWMGTLNDWFTNFGFTEFSYRNGELTNGDTIHVQFTQDLGEDLSGTWGNSDTSLKELQVSGGTLTPVFASGAAPGGNYEYALVIPGDSASVKITPTAANKNYLVKAFLNEKVTGNAEGNSFYKRTEPISVHVGDTVYIGVGEYAWPSMNNQETEARNYTGTWYELHMISASDGAGYANGVISRLPAAERITSGNCESRRSSIEYARTIFEVLDAAEKEKVDLTKLTAAEARLAFFDQIQRIKTLMEAIPDAATITEENMEAIADQVLAAEADYKALSDEQKLYFTVGVVANYNAAIEMLTEMGAFDPGDEPTPIEKSELEALLAEAVQIENVGYTEESWANFTEALQAAQAVNAKEDATQEEIDAACEALTNAKAQLVILNTEAKKVDDLIAKISDPVTLADKAKIEEARAAFNALPDTQKGLVSKYQQLEAAEASLAQLLKPVQNVEKQIEELPAAISGSEEDLAALIRASEAFDQLSDQEKAQLDKKLKEKLLELQEEAAKINHTSNGVQIDGLPWYIVLTAEPISGGEDYEAVKEEADKTLTVLGIYDLTLQRLTVNGFVEYQLDGETAAITITVPDLAKYKNIKIIHQLANGEYEYITPSQIEGDKVTFIVESLSKYAVVGQLIETEPEPTHPPGDEQNKPSADGKQVKTDQARTGSATGDYNSALTIAVFLLIALSAGGYLYRRRGKEENSL